MKRSIWTTGLFIILILNNPAIAERFERTDILFDAMSPYEDLTEYALSQDEQGVEKTLKILDTSSEKIKNFLPHKAVQDLNENIEILKTAKENANFQLIALCAIDSYKTISEELDISTMKIPKEVLLLDYAGFKVHALLAQQLVNWELVTQTVNEGESQWKSIQGNVSDKSLSDTMKTSIDGMQAAVKLRNVDMLRFAAQITLDLVDLLENFFIEKPKELTKIPPGKYIYPLISPRNALSLYPLCPPIIGGQSLSSV